MGLFDWPVSGTMVKHNHQIQKCHFHKKWQTRVKTWLDQPMRAKRRRMTRLAKAAKISPRPIAGALRPAVHCPTVKYNRKNRSEESLQANVQRLKTYKANLVVFPRRSKKVKSGDASAEDLSKAVASKGAVQPLVKPSPRQKAVKVDPKAKSAYVTMRIARSDAKYVGVRAKRAQEKIEKEKAEAAK